MRTAIYARVSTYDQDASMQSSELRTFLDYKKWPLVDSYIDTASGAKASRPELDRLMRDVHARKVDAVVCYKLDRFGRSAVDLLNKLNEFQTAGVRFICPNQSIDTDENSPLGTC